MFPHYIYKNTHNHHTNAMLYAAFVHCICVILDGCESLLLSSSPCTSFTLCMSPFLSFKWFVIRLSCIIQTLEVLSFTVFPFAFSFESHFFRHHISFPTFAYTCNIIYWIVTKIAIQWDPHRYSKTHYGMVI